jgi:hypothetical protein
MRPRSVPNQLMSWLPLTVPVATGGPVVMRPVELLRSSRSVELISASKPITQVGATCQL